MIDDLAAAPAVASDLRDSVRQPTLSQRVASALVRLIVRGEFEPGATLPSEDELAARFDVSRPVIREAVKELSLIGLIERRQGRLTRVAPKAEWNQFDPRLLEARSEMGSVDQVLLELLELRRLIETGAAGLAAQRRTEGDLAALEAALTEMDGADNDVDRLTDADIRFHDALLLATGNILLVDLIDLLAPLLRVGRRISLVRRPGGQPLSRAGHAAILTAVRDGDPDRAREEMFDHLSWTADLTLDG